MNLIETTQKYVCYTEIEAKDMIERFRAEANSKGYIVKKAGYEYKTKKSKGEIIGEAWIVSVTQVFGTIWGED